MGKSQQKKLTEKTGLEPGYEERVGFRKEDIQGRNEYSHGREKGAEEQGAL